MYYRFLFVIIFFPFITNGQCDPILKEIWDSSKFDDYLVSGIQMYKKEINDNPRYLVLLHYNYDTAFNNFSISLLSSYNASVFLDYKKYSHYFVIGKDTILVYNNIWLKRYSNINLQSVNNDFLSKIIKDRNDEGYYRMNISATIFEKKNNYFIRCVARSFAYDHIKF